MLTVRTDGASDGSGRIRPATATTPMVPDLTAAANSGHASADSKGSTTAGAPAGKEAAAAAGGARSAFKFPEPKAKDAGKPLVSVQAGLGGKQKDGV